METSSIDRAALMAQAIEALRRANPARARRTFEHIVESGQGDASTFVGIAFACRALQDKPGTIAAVDRALALEPRNLQALIVKGDFLAEAGDARAAASFYRGAVRAAGPPERLPPDLRREVERASGLCVSGEEPAWEI